MRPHICILHTGGTIGMQETENGYAPKEGFLEKELSKLSELKEDSMPTWELTELSPLLDSSNIAVREWNRIGEEIRKRYDDFDGFVILHGTDTMAYTSSALSFMLEGLQKPVILTGSQIPLCKVRSDGRENLITSLILASSGKIHEVALYCGGKLFRGNRVVKLSSNAFDAFDSPNFPPLAKVGVDIQYADFLNENEKGRTEKFHVQPFTEAPIGVIKTFPGIQFSLFEPIFTEELRGIVLETFGTGNIPGDGNALLPLLKKAAENGTLLTVVSQCPYGKVMLGAYETSHALVKAGAVSGKDMTTEACVAKLYYLFSLGYDFASCKMQMEKSLRGELTEA